MCGKNPRSSSVTEASRSSTGSGQPRKTCRSSATDNTGSPSFQGTSNHQCNSPSPVGISPQCALRPAMLSVMCPCAMGSSLLVRPCQLAQPVGRAGSPPSTSRRTTERCPSAPITTSPVTELPSANSTTTWSGCSMTPVQRRPKCSTPGGRAAAISAISLRRGIWTVGDPRRSVTSPRSASQSSLPVSVTERRLCSGRPAASMSTPSSRSAAVPLLHTVMPAPVVRRASACSKTCT